MFLPVHSCQYDAKMYFSDPRFRHKVSVRHSGPKGFIAAKESWFATLVTNVTKEGNYEYCFTNLSPGPHVLGFHLSVIDDETILRSYNEGERDTTPPELKKMWETVAYISKRMRLISLDTHRHLKLVTEDRHRAIKKFTYVNHWSLAQCILIVTAGVAQVSILRYILRPAKPLASIKDQRTERI
ncbi:hypothetical protein BSL78_04719 [Apostichopus japonicus]|uniref:GOLD domain-containing protein n=1 Tax=Stichopus japonicus TaxID=307972 RepID=A0A2G8LDK8_STIJA|nr:hypothetical protein BSL78_04719 [Apostichopus japonicus]